MSKNDNNSRILISNDIWSTELILQVHKLGRALLSKVLRELMNDSHEGLMPPPGR